MDKSLSQMMKGVAILLMLFYHLFNRIGNVDLCDNFIFISGLPLVSILSKATNPVAFFLILGGYGLYKVNEKGDKNRWNRIIKLYIHYWLTLLIFVSIGHFIHPQLYPGNWIIAIANLTGFISSYNHEMWFLFPYVVLSACAPYIFRFYRRFKSCGIVLVTFVVFLITQLTIESHRSFFYENYWAYNSILVPNLLFNFTLGALAARARFFEKIRERYQWLPPTLRLVGWIILGGSLVAIQCVTKYDYFYAFFIISLLSVIKIPSLCKKILIPLGNQ